MVHVLFSVPGRNVGLLAAVVVHHALMVCSGEVTVAARPVAHGVGVVASGSPREIASLVWEVVGNGADRECGLDLCEDEGDGRCFFLAGVRVTTLGDDDIAHSVPR